MRSFAFSLLLQVGLFCSAAFSQTITASITGTVSDETGAAIPNAKVVATNAATSLTYTAQTNGVGVYNLPFLPVGNYNIAAESSGFKKATLGPFSLEVNQIARVDFKMEVGELTQTVEVSGSAPILQTESTATGDAINSSKLTSIPLNGRNFANLTLLIPGAISTSPTVMSTSARFQSSGSRPQVNGNREQTNNFLLDGVETGETVGNRIGYQPNVDALEEVKVITGNGGGEYGNVGGASVVMTLKSGTNEFHGNVFEFLRNDKLDANGYFANRSGAKRNAFRRNIFGGTFGGPIKRNKAFFFVDYEGTEQRISGPAAASVAPDTWRTGDLSQFLTQNTIVRDPLTGTSAATRAPFAGNIIPTARITNPVAQKLFSSPDLYPLPNNPGTGPLRVTNNYLASSASKLGNHQADAKADIRLTDKDSLSGRWSIGRYESLGSRNPLPEQMTGGTNGPTTSAVLSWTRTYTPRLVNESRISYSRTGVADNTLDWSGLLGSDGNAKFGIGGGQPIPGLSGITVGGGLTGIGAGASIADSKQNNYQAQTHFTYQAAAHLLKFGGQLFRAQQNHYYAGNNGALGTFTYSGGYSGLDYGDFLLNTLSAKGRGAVTGKWGQRHWRNAVYFQDDWKARRNLTLNLGMRWEYISPLYEVADRQVNINTYTGQLIYPGKTEYGRGLYKPYRKQFMPTVGIAWTPDMFQNKLVVRAGYRFSSFLEGTGANLRLPLNPPFFIESNVNYDATSPGDIRTGFSDVIGAGDLTSPRTGSAPFYQARAWDLDLRPQFTNQYNFALEYQFGKATSVSAAYVGNHATHLIVPHEANQPLPGAGPFSTWINLNDRRPLAKVLPNVGNIALTESSGTSRYNSLQMTARHRMSGGLELISSYTFSKTLTDNLGYYGCAAVNSDGAYWQNAYDRHANFGPACFDATHNFSVGGLYALPVGKGKRFGTGMAKAADLLLGGWNVNYFLTAHSGFPVTVTAAAAQTNTGQSVRGNVRANYYRPMTITSQTVDRFFGPVDASTFCAAGVDNGTCSYGLPSLGTFGTAGVGTLRAPSYFNLDASIGKIFYITERQRLDFRVEFFNIANHVSFGPPGRDITSVGSFGQITSQVTSPRNIQFGLKYNF
ncbi:MAG: TonB-dependent receptor [Bryobacterales bacterium]|nr:TonB-dependent receptor [Bryobacterales bacterium]